MKKWAPYILIALVLVAIILVRTCKQEQQPAPKPRVTNNNKPKDPSAKAAHREKGFDRNISYLEYSKHASCRMECRKISRSEVEEIMQEGKINYNKSDLQAARCPRYAVEGTTADGQEVRIVFAQCDEKTVVVTVIDLEKEYECNCPGTDHKYQNKN